MEPDDQVNALTDHGCFGCGEQNPIGLRLKFHRRDGAVQARFTPKASHEGYTRMAHGGIVATLLDEAMSWAVIDRGRLAVTAKIEVQFRHPVPIGTPLVVIGRVERDRGRVIESRGELRTESGELLASANGLFVRVNDEQQRAWEATYYRAEPGEG